jgi:hypothetical protein
VEVQKWLRQQSKDFYAEGFNALVQGLTIRFVNSAPCACRGSSGQKPQYGLMTLAYQHFTAVLLLLIYGSLFLSSVYYCLSVFPCAVMRIRELKLEQ